MSATDGVLSDHHKQVAPSTVVQVIENMFPDVKRGEQVQLYHGQAGAIAAVLGLVERVPERLLELDPADYANFLMSVSALRASVDAWARQGARHLPDQQLRGTGKSPLVWIYEGLKCYPDARPSPETAELKFVADDKFRTALRLDIDAAYEALGNQGWKAATVLGGSVVEALLLWAVQKLGRDARREAIKRAVKSGYLESEPRGRAESWILHEYIGVAFHGRLIGEECRKQCDVTKDYSDLIHPGRGARLGHPCDRGTAHAAAAAMEAVLRDLNKKFGAKSRKQETA